MSFNIMESHHMASLASANPTSPPSTQRVSTEIESTISTQIPTVEEIERKPWKYIGYKGYAEFIASDNDFYIMRRFRALNARVALALQDELAILEEKLDKLDKHYSKREAEDLHNGSFRDDREDRTELVSTIREKLIQYSEYVRGAKGWKLLLTW